jgi:hypothetical protein
MIDNHSWIIISSLGSSVIALALYIRHLHNRYGKDQKETIEKVVTALVNNTNSNEHVREALKNNTAMFDRLFNKIDSLRK